MKIAARMSGVLIMALLLGLTACGGGDDAPAPAPAPPPPPPPAGTVIGAAGGTVTGPSGTSVVIPAGALAGDTRINIEVVTSGAPALPTGFTTTGGQKIAFTPHGTTFAAPVTVTIPFDPASVPAGQFPAFYKTNAQNLWEKIPNAVFSATNVSAQVTSFSIFDVLNPPLFVGKPVYQWDIIELKGDALEEQVAVLGAGNSEGVAQHHDFGSAHRDAEVFSFDGSLVVPSDDKATSQIAGTADGSDWWVGNEAPLGIIGAPDDTIGMKTVFRQTQTFTKLENDATLSFYIINAFLQTSDANGILNRGCPRGHLDGLFCDAISAQLTFEAIAFTEPSEPSEEPEYFFTLSGSAHLTGIAGSWDSRASTDAMSRQELWDIEDFTFDIEEIENHEEALITMELAHPIFHEYFVDLSDIEVGESFTLHFEASTTAYNRAASQVNNVGPEFETSARAYLRDPRRPLGVGIVAAGVEAIDTETPLVLPPVVPLAPEPCVPGPGPDPAAGTLQFNAANYTQLESSAAPSITVTRTGGTLGAVTATFRTSDGSAVAGTDYTALATTVFFDAGDSAPRVVTLDITANTASNEPDKTVNLTLSEPGGCAALGARTTAVLTIKDDDLPPPPPSFTVGGTVTGLEGEGLTLRDHQFLTLTPDNGPFTFPLPTQSGSPYEVTIFTQPTNPVQVCSLFNGSGTMGNANITNIVVSCETPSTPGGLDPEFGGGTGIVSTPFGGDETDMLVQPDGMILMIGGSGTDFVMARYDIDGNLDGSFGDNGLVTTDIAGGADAAFGAALLSDGRIVVVGSARVGGNDDFAIARYKADGSPDESFSGDGKTTTDFFFGRDRAFAVAVFPDNSVVVAGDTLLAAGAGSDFAVARYDASGELDTGFGGGDGMLNTDIERVDIAKNVVIESGGTILVTGVTTLGSSSALGHAGLARYSAAGAPDPSLNTTGKLSIPNRALGEALAVQSDGRILVAGNAPVGGRPNFAVMRLEANGAVDSSFGGGLATAGFTAQDDYGRDVVIDSEGRILVSGQASNLSNPDFAVARFTSAGVLDTSFSDDGKFTVDFFDASDSAENVAVQADGKIVLGGFAVNGTRTQYGVARLNP